MKLKSLELYNIGPFRRRNIIHFHSDYKYNTILFGGRNGSGKTTLLKSVRIGLYGSLGYGYRTNSETYLLIVSKLLNDDASTDEQFSVKLTFDLSNQFETNEYTINRSWKYDDDKIIENVQVFCDDTLLTPVEMDDFFELLKTQFAPSLMKLCFFDGEDILNTTDDDLLLSNYLKELVYKLFDIELYQSLESSLEKYLFTTIDSEEIKELKNKVDKLDEQVNIHREKLDDLQNKLKENQNEIDELQLLNSQLEEEFLTHGGLFYEQQQKIEREIYYLEHERKVKNDNVKVFIGNQLPFYLIYNLFNKLIVQLNKEKEFYVSQELSDKIEQLPIKQLLDKLNITKLDNSIEHYFKNELIGMITNNVDVDMIHKLSTAETNRIISIHEQLTKDNLMGISNQLQESRKNLKHLRKLKSSLEEQEKAVEFKDLLNEINNNNNQIQYKEKLIDDLNRQINEGRFIYDELKQQLDGAKQKLSLAIRQKGSLTEAEKSVKVIRKFTEKRIWNKLADVEHLTLLMINKLFRKKNYISSVKINPVTFELKLFDETQKKINKNLSAGENQLVVLAIFWAIVKASKKQIPIIFDTLLGRLDSVHSKSIVDILVPEFGEQVIILATDTEINKDLYREMKKNVSQEYTLEYSTKEKKTDIIKGFFNF